MSENSSTFFMTGTLSSAFSLCGLLIVSVEDCKVFLVRLIEICVNLVVSVVNGLECRVRFKDLSRRDKLFRFADILYKTRADGYCYRRADSANILRTVNGFNGSARAVCEYLAGDIVKSTAAYKTNSA